MGDPLTALLCGAVGLGMALWNWHMVARARKQAREGACERARNRAAAYSNPRSIASPVEVTSSAAAVAATSLKFAIENRPRRSFRLDPPPECPTNTPVDDPSPLQLIIKATRDRIGTEPLSPPRSSQQAQAMRFFKERAEDEGHAWHKISYVYRNG